MVAGKSYRHGDFQGRGAKTMGPRVHDWPPSPPTSASRVARILAGVHAFERCSVLLSADGHKHDRILKSRSCPQTAAQQYATQHTDCVASPRNNHVTGSPILSLPHLLYMYSTSWLKRCPPDLLQVTWALLHSSCRHSIYSAALAMQATTASAGAEECREKCTDTHSVLNRKRCNHRACTQPA